MASKFNQRANRDRTLLGLVGVGIARNANTPAGVMALTTANAGVVPTTSEISASTSPAALYDRSRLMSSTLINFVGSREA